MSATTVIRQNQEVANAPATAGPASVIRFVSRRDGKEACFRYSQQQLLLSLLLLLPLLLLQLLPSLLPLLLLLQLLMPMLPPLRQQHRQQQRRKQ